MSDIRLLPSVLLLRSSLHRITRFLPGIQSTQQSSRVLDSILIECEHRTGARVFGRSSTVGRDELVFRQLTKSTGDFI